jgi:DNA-binding NarL/FixJ family response regulator
MRKNGPEIETDNSFDQLTNRQVEIVRLLGVGLTPREIAPKLFISVKTVEIHKTKIFKKLDAHRLVDLVWIAIKLGIVKIEDWENVRHQVHSVIARLGTDHSDGATGNRNRT